MKGETRVSEANRGYGPALCWPHQARLAAGGWAAAAQGGYTTYNV